MRRTLFGIGLSLLFSATVFAQVRVHPEGVRKGNVLFVSLPADLSKESVEFATEATKDRLYKLSAQMARREPAAGDLIVLYVDKAGEVILPNRQSVKAQKAFTTASVADAAVANRLTFTFNSPAYPWSSAEMDALSTALNTFYPVILQVYGDPAFEITVNVRKDPTAWAAGLYSPAFNEMVIKSVDSGMDVLCHELIHAFRDDDISLLDSYEEGMTRAAEVEVYNRIPSLVHWDENHSGLYDVFYEGMNKPAIGSAGGDFFGGYISPLMRYQLAGYAWAKALIVNDHFFIDFNASYYARILQDPTVTGTESALVDIAAGVQASVEGIPFRTWYSQQNVFLTSPPQGYLLFQRLQGDVTIDYFQRDSAGFETMQPNSLVQWVVSDFQGVTLSTGSAMTSANGFVYFTPSVPTGYAGRIKVDASANSPQGLIKDTSFQYVGAQTGVFGVVKNASFGTLTISANDNSIAPITVNVANGGFTIPLLAGLRGEFIAVFQQTGGSTLSKHFTKDASNYFLVLGSENAIQRPTVKITVANANTTESVDNATFTVTRTGSTAAQLVVKYSVGGTATPGVDYPALTGTITIPAGSTQKKFTVSGYYDTLVEGPETVVITLSPNPAYTVISASSATATIWDLPVASITATNPNASESLQRPATFVVSLVEPYFKDVTYNFTVGGTATPGVDYTNLPSQFSIRQGSTSSTYNLTPVDDLLAEPLETIILTLQPPSNCLTRCIATASATATIQDND